MEANLFDLPAPLRDALIEAMPNADVVTKYDEKDLNFHNLTTAHPWILTAGRILSAIGIAGMVGATLNALSHNSAHAQDNSVSINPVENPNLVCQATTDLAEKHGIHAQEGVTDVGMYIFNTQNPDNDIDSVQVCTGGAIPDLINTQDLIAKGNLSTSHDFDASKPGDEVRFIIDTPNIRADYTSYHLDSETDRLVPAGAVTVNGGTHIAQFEDAENGVYAVMKNPPVYPEDLTEKVYLPIVQY